MILLRPYVLAAANRLTKRNDARALLFRDLVLLILGGAIMTAIYLGFHWILDRIGDLLQLAYLSPVVPLVMALLVLIGLLLISNIVNAVGSFYLSSDLDLVLASPITPLKFFWQRMTSVTLGSSAISLVFMLPIFAVYAIRYDTGISYAVLIAAMLIPFFLIPSGLGFIVATILVAFVPLRRSKILLASFIALLLYGMWVGIDIIRLIVQAGAGTQDVIRVVAFFSAAEIPWAPSTWIGSAIAAEIGVVSASIPLRLATLYAVCFSVLMAAQLVFLQWHSRAFSAMSNHRIGKRYRSLFWRPLASITSDANRQWLAIAVKDLKSLSRDMAQLFQGVLLLGIFLMYIYNLRLFAGVHVLGPRAMWWTNFLFVANFSMSAFISTAICTRFVFPSISLEGRSFPLIVLKAPYGLDRYVFGKFQFWYCIVSVLHSFVVGIGTFASGGGGVEVALSVLCSWILCYGLVGLAVGMGAIYSRFDWESVSQLAVGFGNIMFMLSATSVILLNIIPIWILFRIVAWTGLAQHLPVAVTVALSFSVLNFLVGRLALRRGVAALDDYRR